MKTIRILLLTAAVCAAEIFTPGQLRDLDNFVKDVMNCSDLPGLTLAVVKGKEVFTKGYGKRDVENDKNTTADTLFCIGSITKAMTTTLLAKVLPEKFPKTTWDTKLKDILGDSFKLNTDELTDHVTLKDILSHRTGLANGDYALYAGYPPSITRSSLTKKLQYLPWSQPFRYHYDYNNWMYCLAGYVAEVLAGGKESWEDLISRHIFKPLGMNTAAILKNLNQLEKTAELALPYISTQEGRTRMPSEIFNIHPAEPAGSVCSSATDMAKWMKFLLSSSKEIVNETVFSKTMTPVQLTPTAGMNRPKYPVDSYQFGYGMGWFTGAYRGRRQLSHSGGLFAYTSLLWLFPHDEMGVFVSVNGILERGFTKSVILSYISDMILDESPWLNSSTACTFPEPWDVATSANTSKSNQNDDPDVKSQRPLSEYVGVYGHRFMGDVHISINKTLHRLQFRLGEKLEADLHPTLHKDVFKLELTGMFSFLVDPNSTNSDTIHFVPVSDGQLESFSSSAIGKEFIFRTDVRFDGSSSAGRLCSTVIRVYIVVGFFLFLFL